MNPKNFEKKRFCMGLWLGFMKVHDASNLRPFAKWLEQIHRSHVTGWRWRKRGWIKPVNICGRLYISTQAIEEFERKAAAGEFAQESKVGNIRAEEGDHNERGEC